MTIQFQDINLEVIPNGQHDWLLESALVAQGYGISTSSLRSTKSRNEDELQEGVHYVLQNATIANGGKKPKIFWTKQGVTTLGFFINSDKAKQFRKWAAALVLKVMERPVDKIQSLEEHTKRDVQISNTKKVTSYIFSQWDVETLKEYHRKNCQMVSGYSPSELKKIGKSKGLKSTQYASGKEVLRALKPELAAQMSLNDDLVQSGVKLAEANALSAPCVPLLNKMIELKMISR